ncbi:M12 family metallo-peptidase [Pelagicoccus mobilis]|uniref:PKD/Chitinase domain-containing protein n=1 Tax=Pelagicoccus mobilis TaxID=415221 RepID=A0A934S6B1_9BACT|nr:M12 family metallo-peptidase [Pelagicoccus mobilis]MBK1880542.1 hypothetical protein [Pelagicoccus mobilis]
MKARFQITWAMFLACLGFAASFAWSAEIDVLAVYTDPVGKEHNGQDGVVALMQGAVDSANFSFERSEIDLRLRLVGVEHTDLVQDTSDMSLDLARLAERDGVADEVLDLRDELGADLVCLVREGSVLGTDGVAYLLADENGDEETGFLVVNSYSLVVTHLFEHEVGHTLGAAHDRENSASPGLFSFSYGHRFDVPPFQYRTIMAYDPGVPIGYFSNPQINYDGVATGVTRGSFGEADNAETFRRTAPYVSGYYPRLPIKPIVSVRDQYLYTDLDDNGSEAVRVEPHVVFRGAEELTWSWTWEGGQSNSKVLEANFPVGETTVDLEVSGGGGMSSSYTVVINVSEVASVAQIAGGGRYSLALMDNGLLYLVGDPAELLKGDFSNHSGDLYPIDEDVTFAVASKVGHPFDTAYVKGNGALWGIGRIAEEYGIDDAEGSGLGNRLLIESGVSEIALGDYFGLVLRTDGALLGYGTNEYGQIGPLASFSESSVFGEIGVGDVLSIAASEDSSAFVREDGSLWGMGRIFNYDAGNAVISDAPVRLVDSGIVKVSAGNRHFMALSEEGSVYVSGWNEWQQLGLDYVEWVTGFQKLEGVVAKDIHCSGYHSLVTLMDGSALLWGHVLSDPGNDYHEYERTLFRGNVVSIEMQGANVMALKDDGSLWKIERYFRQHPHSGARTFHYDTIPKRILEPTVEPVASPPVAIAGNDFTVIGETLGPNAKVLLDGSASYDNWSVQRWTWTWDGGSASGRRASIDLPEGETTVRLEVADDEGVTDVDEVLVRVEKPDTGKVVEAVDGGSLRLYRTENGFFAAMGQNWNQVFEGVQNGGWVHLPRILDDSGNVEKIAGGRDFFLVLRKDGSLWANGSRYEGQLGPKAGNWNNFVPVEMFSEGVRAIEAGREHTLVVMDDGSLHVAGRNRNGLLGAGEAEWMSRQFVRVLDSDVLLARTGWNHSLALMEDGTVWGMGANGSGAIRPEEGGVFYQPVKMDVEGVIDAACSNLASYLLKEDGSLWVVQNGGIRKLLSLIPDEFRDSFSERLSRGIQKMDCYGTDLFLLLGDGSLWRIRVDSLVWTKWKDSVEQLFASRVVDFSPEGIVVRDDGTVWGTGYGWDGVEHEASNWSAELSEGFVEQVPSAEPETLVPAIIAPPGVSIDFSDGRGVLPLSGAFTRGEWKIASWTWTVGGIGYSGQNVELELEQGSYAITLSVEDSEGVSKTESVEVEVVDPRVFEDWLKIFWREEEIAALGDGIEDLDMDHDSLTTREEWKLRMDPTDFDSRIDVKSRVEDGKLELRVRRIDGTEGVGYYLLSSDDGKVWGEPDSWNLQFEDKWLIWSGLDPTLLYKFEARSDFGM